MIHVPKSKTSKTLSAILAVSIGTQQLLLTLSIFLFSAVAVLSNPQSASADPMIDSFSIGTGNPTYTNTTNVALKSSVMGTTHMRFSNDGVDFSPTVAYNANFDWVLNAANGQKTVTAMFIDVHGSGNLVIEMGSDTIFLDDQAPGSSNKSPASNATAIAVNSNITLDINDPNKDGYNSGIDASTVSGANFYLKDSMDMTVPAAVSFAGGTATINPDSDLVEGQLYTAYATEGIKDNAGNTLPAQSWSFRTVESIPPAVTIANIVSSQVITASWTTGSSFVTGAISKDVTGTANDSSTGGSNITGVQVTVQRDSDNYYWNSTTNQWQDTEAWNDATISSGAGTPAVNWTFKWNIAPLVQEGAPAYAINARATDSSANTGNAAAVTGVTLNTTHPIVNSFVLGEGDPIYTNTREVTLFMDVTDAVAFRIADTTHKHTIPWQYLPFDNFTMSFTLPVNVDNNITKPQNGKRTVWAWFKNSLGNEYPISDSIFFDDQIPAAYNSLPAVGSTGASIRNDITFSLTDPIKAPSTSPSESYSSGILTASVSTESVTIKDSMNMPVTANVSFTSGTVTVNPDADLQYGETYTIGLTSDIKDNAGNSLTDQSWSFTTQQTDAPVVNITDPTSTEKLTGDGPQIITGTANDSATGSSNITNVDVKIQRANDNWYWNGTTELWQEGEAWNAATITAGSGTTNVNWQYSWVNSPAAQDGSPVYTITGRATDELAFTGESSATGVTIDNMDLDPPVVAITNPIDSQTITGEGPKLITGIANDTLTGNSSIQNVKVSIKRGSDNQYWDGEMAMWGEAQTWNTAAIEENAGITSKHGGQGPANVLWAYSWAFMPMEQDGTVTYTIEAKATDVDTNEGAATPVTGVKIDNVAPAVTSFSIGNGNPTYTKTRNVTLYSNVTGASKMAFSNTNASFTEFDYTATGSWPLSSGDGTKTVNAKYTDGAGNVSTATDTIILDATPPSAEFKSTVKAQGSHVKGTLAVPVTATDGLSGIDKVELYWGTTKLATDETSPFNPSVNTATKLSNGRVTLKVVAYDNAGNAKTITRYFFIDNTKPRTKAPVGAIASKGIHADLIYQVNDKFSAKAQVKIKIKNAGGTVVKTLSLGRKLTNEPHVYSYNHALAKGTYSFEVYATDLAGNTQYNIAKNKLTIF